MEDWHVCYSAMVYAEISKLERKLGIKIDPDWYVEEFWIKKGKDPSKRPRVPRALELDALANGPPGIAAAVAEADRAEVDRRSEARREGTACVRTGRSRVSPCH